MFSVAEQTKILNMGIKINQNYCDRDIKLVTLGGEEIDVPKNEIFETHSEYLEWNKSILKNAYYKGIEIKISSLPRNYYTK